MLNKIICEYVLNKLDPEEIAGVEKLIVGAPKVRIAEKIILAKQLTPGELEEKIRTRNFEFLDNPKVAPSKGEK